MYTIQNVIQVVFDLNKLLLGVLKLKFQQLDFDVIKNVRHPKIELHDGWARVKQD